MSQLGPWHLGDPMLMSATQASTFLLGLSSGENGEVYGDFFISSLVSTAASLPFFQDGPTVASLLPDNLVNGFRKNAIISLYLHFPQFLGEGGQQLLGVICLWAILSLSISFSTF